MKNLFFLFPGKYFDKKIIIFLIYYFTFRRNNVENYIITNKTIAITKKYKKTIIYDVDNIRIINKNINKILELNCNFYGNDINFIKKQVKNVLNIHYKIPIIINNSVFIQLFNLRSNNCIFININKIIDYKINDNKLEIICYKRKFILDLSKSTFEKNLLNGVKLNNIINIKKTTNFV